jgi:hypothetical protein
VHRRGERTHLGRWIERVPDSNRSRECDEALEELVGDRLVEDEAAACDAGLTLVVEDREGGAVHGRDEVGVVEHDVRALASELQLDALEVGRRVLDDALADARRSGERDLGDVGVGGEAFSGSGAEAGDHVDDTGRDADVDHQLGQPER